MGKKLIINLVLVIIILILILYFYPTYNCQFKTRSYSEETTKLKEEVLNMNCYDDPDITQDYFDLNCKPIIDEYNQLIREWANLPCVDVGLIEEEIIEQKTK